MMRGILRMLRLIPRALERALLQWALTEIHPMHPDVPDIVRRIAELEDA